MTAPPRFPLAAAPTPLQHATGLEEAFGAGPIWVKRDDLTGFAVAGNKARTLEYLLGDALAQGADTFVATGSPGSNFCAAAAVAARVAGLACEIVHSGGPPDPVPATLRLSRAAGATVTFEPSLARQQLDEAVGRHAARLREAGRRPYAVPRGGATPVGAVGCATAVGELTEQAEAAGLGSCTVVVATGSGTSQAGLLAGRASTAIPVRVIGASVSRPTETVRPHVHQLAGACAHLLGLPGPDASDVEVRDAVGPGFGIAAPEDRDSSRVALTTAGLLLDDTYGAKAMTVLRDLARHGHDEPLVFWHTGGVMGALAALDGSAT